MRENGETKKPRAGDRVCYSRHTDGTEVKGTIAAVYERDHNSNLFRNSQLEEEQTAYRLSLSSEDAARIGHPVTVGASRCALIEGERKDG